MSTPPDSIPGHHPKLPPPLEIINGEEEWIVEEILDSKMVNRKLQYLVKWEVTGLNITLGNPGIASMHQTLSQTSTRNTLGPLNMLGLPLSKLFPSDPGRVLRCHSLEGMDVRGHYFSDFSETILSLPRLFCHCPSEICPSLPRLLHHCLCLCRAIDIYFCLHFCSIATSLLPTFC